jgi:hypothetical protein
MKKEKFISIIFKSNPKDSNISVLVDFLKGLIGSYINPLFTDRVLTVFFDADCDVSFMEIIESLNEDFYITSLLFESGELYTNLDKGEYVDFIISNKDLLLETNKLYLNESKLIEHKIYNEIVVKNILKNYYNDFEMKNIIRTYLESNMNISKASNILYMHRNTLMYKIDNFIKVTGFDVKKFKDAYIIYHII